VTLLTLPQVRQKLLEAGHAALQAAPAYPNEPTPLLGSGLGSNFLSRAHSSPPPVCTRAPAFLSPGPLVIGGVGDSGTSAVVSLCQSAVTLRVCTDYGGSLDALYMLKPETVTGQVASACVAFSE
jgi:hypothetical protein